jgi:homoserine kinase
LGVAVGLWNEVVFSAPLGFQSVATRDWSIEIAGAGVDVLSRDASNLVIQAAQHVFKRAGRWPKRLEAQLINRIPLSRGLGSSSAAIVGGLAAANRLLGDPLKRDDLLALAVEMEGHPDNVVPALVGGFCVSGLFDGKPRYWTLPAPKDLRAVVCVPELPLATKDARRVLPKKVLIKDAVFTSSRVAFVIGALLQKRYDWLAAAMEDRLHQPARARLIPGLMDAITAAKKAGAYGAALSGAGSCVLALAPASKAAAAGKAMQAVFSKHKILSHWLNLNLENQGVRYS